MNVEVEPLIYGVLFQINLMGVHLMLLLKLF